MKKSLRSVEKSSNERYEYLRVDADAAAKLVDEKTHVYVGKEEFKHQSIAYQANPCRGTVVNIKNADKITTGQQCLHNIDYTKWMGKKKVPASTKIAKCSSNIATVVRTNKYNIKFKTTKKRKPVVKEVVAAVAQD